MRILIVEDDPTLNTQIYEALLRDGYVVDQAYDGEEGHFLGDTEPYDAVILDIGLPKIDGLTILQKWRHANKAMPILMLTARDQWSDKVSAIDNGADDYLTKPFHMEELCARIRALIRRAAGHASNILEFDVFKLDLKNSIFTEGDKPIKLTALEYRLLAYLMTHHERVISKTELTEHLYDQDFDKDSNTIEVFVGRLRKKIERPIIQTVRGIGYQFVKS